MNKVTSLILLSSLISTLPISAQKAEDPVPKESKKTVGNPISKKELQTMHLEKLFSGIPPEEFNKALSNAKSSGIHPQVLLEAEFLHLIDQVDDKALANISTRLLDYSSKFDPNKSQIFTVKEDWLAITEYTQALAALETGNHTSFKKHITEAFWLSPSQGPIFAPYINQLRLDQIMKSTTVDQNTTLHVQGNNKPVSLESLTQNGTYLLYFWSPHSQEFHANIPEFIKLNALTNEKNIPTLSILTESNPQTIEDAKTMEKEALSKISSEWLMHSKDNTLIQQLRITAIPTAVLINKEGNIIFNGHPQDPQLTASIKKISTKKITPPNIE